MNIHKVMASMLKGEVVKGEFIHAEKVYTFRAEESPFLLATDGEGKKLGLFQIVIGEAKE